MINLFKLLGKLTAAFYLLIKKKTQRLVNL